MKILKKVIAIVYLTCFVISIVGIVLPQRFTIPVEGAQEGDWNENTFWFYPWGKSVVHKGVDIFAPTGTDVLSSTHGIVVYKGTIGRGGNVVLILGPKWRLHYYAHLQEYNVKPGERVRRGEPIGKVGNTGNAINTPAHLHYSILTLIPYPWLIDTDVHGWKKMIYLNPLRYF